MDTYRSLVLEETKETKVKGWAIFSYIGQVKNPCITKSLLYKKSLLVYGLEFQHFYLYLCVNFDSN